MRCFVVASWPSFKRFLSTYPTSLPSLSLSIKTWGPEVCQITSNGLILPLYLASAKSEAPIYTCLIDFRQWTLNQCKKKSSNLYLTLGENHTIEKHKLETAINKELTTAQRKTSKEHVTSISWHLSPQYSHVTLVSRYPILTEVNWL